MVFRKPVLPVKTYSKDDIHPDDLNDPFFNMLRALWGDEWEVVYAGPLRHSTRKIAQEINDERRKKAGG